MKIVKRILLIIVLLCLHLKVNSQAEIKQEKSTSLSSKKIKRIDEFIESKRSFYNSPSIAVAITDEKETVYLKHFGNAKKGDKYLIGSNSKSLTGLIILLLQEKGLLNINEPVKKYLKWFEYDDKSVSDKITIKNLLQHESGISTKMGRVFKTDNSFDYVDYYSQKLKELKISSSKQSFKYSNANYRLLGFIIEKVTGKSYEKCLSEFIAKPMKLNATAGNVNVNLIDSYQYFLYDPILKFNKKLHHQEIASALVSSSANDMSVYLRNLMNSYNKEDNAIINSSITEQLFNINDNDSPYGLGWFLIKKPLVFYHNGTNKSFESSMYILPELKKGIVVLINSNQAPAIEIINGIHSILVDEKIYRKSSFRYYRALPIVVLVFLVIFLFSFVKWIRNRFPIKRSNRVGVNILFLLAVLFCVGILIVFPKLNGASLQTAIQFDPSSGYSIILISILTLFSALFAYFNSKNK